MQTMSLSRILAAWGSVAGLVLLVVACSEAPPTEYGTPANEAPAVPMTFAVSTEEVPEHVVLVEGRVVEVCRSAGCWLVLEDETPAAGDDGKAPGRLYVDLKPAATFTVPAGIVGHRATVSGRLMGDAADRSIHAVGMRLVPER